MDGPVDMANLVPNGSEYTPRGIYRRNLYSVKRMLHAGQGTIG